MHWQEYYLQLQKDLALNLRENITVDYGKIIYESPIFENTRWLVTSFSDEYNVFVDRYLDTGSVDRCLGATFMWKNRALDFALRMFLVCSGGLRRENRWVKYE